MLSAIMPYMLGHANKRARTMIKNKIFLEVDGKDKTFRFECDPGASLGEIFDCLTKMQHFVAEKIKEAIPKLTEKEEKHA